MLVNIEPDPNEENHESGVEICENGNRSTRTEKSCLTVTNVPAIVFTSDKELFEELFKQHGDIMSIIYLKSFSRARVIYHNENDSCQAKDKLHGSTMEGNQLGVYFTQIPNIPNISQTLQPPPPVKQFLISPPVSPPVNWKPITEGSPVINHDLLSAIAQLKPDEPYEAHMSTGDQPSITVHWCEDDDGEEETKERPMRSLPRHMVQTRKPDTKPN
ncbi:calcipressin-2-like isoform X2 [Dendronephthya gigantea]|uniref:calcipressin-2-like isoform X2 n=1 Tax=Dendronephthya gigantea TaxID=151771 RepID=UPI00106CE324|nr:calcipressin-2-like isoform X2 [Dendronephthya gigantea]